VTPGQSGAALAAAVTGFLADHGVAMTDLVVGRTLEDVYFAAVGPDATTTAADPPESTTVARAARRRRRSRR
jgi:hypothetical protein